MIAFGEEIGGDVEIALQRGENVDSVGLWR